MHKLIYNTLNGSYQTFSSLHPKLQEIVSASPFFMVDSDEKVVLAPTTTAILASHLYSLETMVDVTRRTVAVDSASIIEKTLKATSKLDEIRTTELIIRQMKKMGIDNEVILKMMDNTIERVPKSPSENETEEETTRIHDEEKTTHADDITTLSNQKNIESVSEKEEIPNVWELNE
jgi:hypothetical protein